MAIKPDAGNDGTISLAKGTEPETSASAPKTFSCGGFGGGGGGGGLIIASTIAFALLALDLFKKKK